MNIVQIVFSPTGGTQKVADTLTEQLGTTVRHIDLSDAGVDFSSVQLEKDDIAVIAVPSFGGRVPALASGRLSAVHGNQARCVLVGVYGNRAYEDTLTELNDVAVSCGFQTVAAVAAIAEHSIAHQYAAGRPDDQDRKTLHDFAEKIAKNWRTLPGMSLLSKFPEIIPTKSGRRRSDSESRFQLHKLRPLRGTLSGSGNQQRESPEHRQQQMYFLYALRRTVSSVCPQSQQRYGIRCGPCPEKILFRPERAGTLSLILQPFSQLNNILPSAKGLQPESCSPFAAKQFFSVPHSPLSSGNSLLSS